MWYLEFNSFKWLISLKKGYLGRNSSVQESNSNIAIFYFSFYVELQILNYFIKKITLEQSADDIIVWFVIYYNLHTEQYFKSKNNIVL